MDAEVLQDLYIKRFYSDNKPRNTLEKVILFQKKLDDFKIRRNSLPNNGAFDPSNLLEEEPNRFRPATNHTTCRMRANKTTFQEGRKADGPATSELRLIFEKRATGEAGPPQSRFQSNLYSAHQQRKKMKLFSYRQSSKQENKNQEQKLTKIDMSHFLTERNISTSERKTRPLVQFKKQQNTSRKVSVSIRENDYEQEQKGTSVSKKVFIGGRDLEKAANQYLKHYQQTHRKIQGQEAAKREELLRLIPQVHPYVEKKKVERRTAARKKRYIIPPTPGINSKTQPKTIKFQDIGANLQLNPWNVEADYY